MSFIHIDEMYCKGCGLCATVCNKNLLSFSDVTSISGYSLVIFKDNSVCTGCASCAQMCPDVAISVFKQ
jgi:2-oxoglutarate ferredoxin oxidoreductase subunit delta